MQILKTKNYDDFKVIMSNREVNKAHVRRLTSSIRRKNLLYIRPIIVNERMELIDGQHRLAACQDLDLDVYYMVVGGISKEDIAILNTAQKNWSRLDFINFYAIEGKVEFKELSKLINKYPELKPSFFLKIIGNCSRLREGIIEITDLEYTSQLCEFLKSLYTRKGFDFAASRDFGVAVHELNLNGWNHRKLSGAITKQNFYKCDSVSEYKKMLKAISI